MCHAEARAQDARRRACRHRLKMVGPSKASPTQRHNDRGADRATARYYPTLAGSPSRSPDRGPGGESQFFAAPPESQSTRTLDTPRAGLWVEMGDARRQPAPNTSTVKALRAFVGGGCLRHHRQTSSPSRRSAAAHQPSTSHDARHQRYQPTCDRPALPALYWPLVRQAERRAGATRTPRRTQSIPPPASLDNMPPTPPPPRAKPPPSPTTTRSACSRSPDSPVRQDVASSPPPPTTHAARSTPR